MSCDVTMTKFGTMHSSVSHIMEFIGRLRKQWGECNRDYEKEEDNVVRRQQLRLYTLRLDIINAR